MCQGSGKNTCTPASDAGATEAPLPRRTLSAPRVPLRITLVALLMALVTVALGVTGFVFEGRPNVFADAAGVIRTGNTVVFRIGSDALHHGGRRMRAPRSV